MGPLWIAYEKSYKSPKSMHANPPGLNRVKKTSHTARKYVTQQPSDQSFKFYQFAREVFVLINGLQQ